MKMEQIVGIVLRSFPLLFSLFLDIVPLNFLDKWSETVHQTDKSELTFGIGETEGFYKQVSIYVFDELRIRYTLSLSLFYIGSLYLVSLIELSNQHLETMNGFAALLFLGLSPLSFYTIRGWFTPEKRSPSRYHTYYIEKSGEDQSRIQKQFKRFSNPSVDRWFAPRKLAIVSQLALILTVVAIEVLSDINAAYWGIATGIILAFLAVLTFPDEGKT